MKYDEMCREVHDWYSPAMDCKADLCEKAEPFILLPLLSSAFCNNLTTTLGLGWDTREPPRNVSVMSMSGHSR